MRSPVGFFITVENAEWCEAEVSLGHFSTFSDVVEFALRDYLLDIKTGFKPEMHRRNQKVRKNVRIEVWVMNSLLDTGMFEKSEVADYAIWHLRARYGENVFGTKPE